MQGNKTLMSAMVLVVGILLLAIVPAAMAMNEELVGAVVKTDQGAALSTDSGEYLLIGKDHLSGMIGKTVVVTGNVEEGSLSKTIRVESVKVLKNKDIIDPATQKVVPRKN